MDSIMVISRVLGVVIGIALIVLAPISVMKCGGIVEFLKRDWQYRFQNRLRNNRYRGLSRPAYAFWCFVYYSVKSVFVAYFYFAFRFFKFVFWDIWKMVFRFEERGWYQRLYFKLHPDELDDCDEYDENDSDSFWNTAVSVENMSGTEFEHFCADLLRINGYSNVRVVAGTGDQGIDVLAEKDDMKWAFQCKRWGAETRVGNDVVQKTFAGKAFYHCDIAVVITTSSFTLKAEEYARETGVLLWDKDKLYNLMEKMSDTE